jgi:hypothetical protein
MGLSYDRNYLLGFAKSKMRIKKRMNRLVFRMSFKQDSENPGFYIKIRQF